MMCYSQFLRLPCLYYFFLTAVKFARIRSEITLLVCWHLEKPSPVKVRSHRMPRRNATQRIQCEHSQLIQRVRLLPYRARSRPNRTRVHTEGSSKAPFTRHNLLSSGCQNGCQIGLTTGCIMYANIQPTTGLTTGCIV